MRNALVRGLLILTGCAVLWVAGYQESPVAAAAQAKAKTASTSTRPEDLDRMLGPIALYPDTLLAQMLLCAGDPAQVTKLAKWLPVNKLTGTALQDAATVDGFDPSFVALTLFPQVVNYLNDNLEWTTRLGKEFAANKTAVFDSIQRLRAQAQKVGNLKDTPQQAIETKTTSSGQQVIVIEPANPQVIYVPQYNPTVVYTTPPTQTVVVKEDDHSDAAAAGIIGFTAGIALGAAMDNNYYYGPYGYHGGAYMYNDAWDDYYDAREDARDDWQDHREDLADQRTDRAENRQDSGTTARAQQNASERQQTRQANGTSAQAQQAAADRRASGQSATTQSATQSTSGTQRQRSTGSEARGYGGSTGADRSGTKSDAFSGYSSGQSQRAASSRGAQSRGASRGGGGRRR
jgi:hypothetical protein